MEVDISREAAITAGEMSGYILMGLNVSEVPEEPLQVRFELLRGGTPFIIVEQVKFFSFSLDARGENDE